MDYHTTKLRKEYINMRMNLRRLREIQHLKLKELARRCNMDMERLRAIENYRELPEFDEVVRILKRTHHYFDEVYQIIWRDIDEHYKLRTYIEHLIIKKYSTLDENISTEELERMFSDE